MCLKIRGFWYMTPCWLVFCYRRFVRSLCLHLQSSRRKISCCENTAYYYSSTLLKLEAVTFSETSVTNQHGIMPRKTYLYQQRCKVFISHIYVVVAATRAACSIAFWLCE